MSSPSYNFAKPGLVEIIVGSILSLLAGLLLACLFLIFKSVPIVEQRPKDAKPDAILFVQGRKDWNSGRRWLQKRDGFLQGQSVSVTEEEMNAWMEAVYPPPLPAGPPPPAAKDQPKKEVEEPWLMQGTPNFRVTPEALTIAVVCDLKVFGLTRKVVLQAEGRFGKVKGTVVFQPDRLHVGRLPVHRFGPVKAIVFRWMANLYEYPEDFEKAWPRLAEARIERRQLVLTVAAAP